MYCPKCGTEQNDDALFCHKCGAKLSGDIATENTTKTAESPIISETVDIDSGHTNPSKKKVLIPVIIASVCILAIASTIIFVRIIKNHNSKTANSNTYNYYIPYVEPEPIQLEKPELNGYFDGDYIVVYWNAIDNATNYHINVNYGQNYIDITDPFIYFPLEPYEDFDLMVQADNPSTDYTISEIAEICGTMLGYEYNELPNFDDAIILPLERLKGWADYYSIPYEITEDTKDGTTLLSISLTDDKNSGFGNRAERAVITGLSAFADTVERRWSEISGEDVIGDVIDNSAETDSLWGSFWMTNQQYQKEIDSEATIYAGLGTLQGIFEDTNIHYIYEYPTIDTDLACRKLTYIIEENGHENLVDNILKEGSWTKIEENLYIDNETYASLGRCVYMKVQEETSNSMYPKWVITLYYQIL